MSMDASWDLKSSPSGQPRSLCVYAAPASSQQTNPFEVAAGTEAPTAQAVVFGTEEGSLHYRTYLTPNSSSTASAAASTGGLGDSSSNTIIAPTTLQPPLGVHTTSKQGGGRSTSTPWPRAYLPVDLAGSSLPGAVVGILPAPITLVATAARPVFLVLVDDAKGSGSSTSSSSSGQYASVLVTLQQGSFSKLPNPSQLTGLPGASTSLPRVSCATYHRRCGFVLCGGRRIYTIPPESLLELSSSSGGSGSGSSKPRSRQHRLSGSTNAPPISFNVLLPAPGARGGQDSLEVTSGGKVAVVAVGTNVYACAGQEEDTANSGASGNSQSELVKLISFAQSSQVHPVIVMDIQDPSMDPDWSSVFCANGRDCAVIDVQYAQDQISSCPPRNGLVTISSPILAAATSWPWLALLTSDGLISIRSPSCLAIPLKTVEVGTRPNDFFCLRTFFDEASLHQQYPSPPTASTAESRLPWIVAGSHSGQAKVLHCQPDTAQDLADRLMRHAIDAFGSNGFPRKELADALHASFTATSYVGPEPNPHALRLLQQYLEAILGLADWEGGASSGWPTEWSSNSSNAAATGGRKSSPKTSTTSFHWSNNHNAFEEAAGSARGRSGPHSSTGQASAVVTAATPNALVTGTALLALICTFLPKVSLANRATKACATKMGVLVITNHSQNNNSPLSPAAVQVCEWVANKLLQEAKGSESNKATSSASPPNRMEFVEAATWLLRSCGRHERAIDVLYERLEQQQQLLLQQQLQPNYTQRAFSSSSVGGFWSSVKYESYTATHLSDLWATSQDAACQLVLRTPATKRLLEQNPRMGLNVFTVLHPQNTKEWKALLAKDDPLVHPQHPSQVVKLLKGIRPALSDSSVADAEPLPLDTGRALAVTYLESAIGIETGRPTEEDAFDLVAPDEEQEDRLSDYHDELCYLLLEGVISERSDERPTEDISVLGKTYRLKLQRFLQWPLAKVRSERLLNALPPTFLQEKALVLGRLGKHEEALRILYMDCQSMDLALEYCDHRHARLQARKEQERARLAAAGLLQDRDNDHHNPFGSNQGSSSSGLGSDCVYLPLVKVALESDVDKKRGTTAAIQVLALRRASIDRAAALRLLPQNIPVAAVARPFLIPALVESESQARRLQVVSSLLRARHNALQLKLTDAQLKAQAHIQVVPQIRAMNLGEPLHSTKAFKARPSSSASSTFPDVVIVKHFFPRHVIIQAKVTNTSMTVDGRSLGKIAFVVAESSEEAIQPLTLVPIKVLPFKATGSTWCVLTAAPTRMEGAATLTCELRYTVLGSEAGALNGGRTFVEELQDLDLVSSNFS